jgi:hypothetical protein
MEKTKLSKKQVHNNYNWLGNWLNGSWLCICDDLTNLKETGLI